MNKITIFKFRIIGILVVGICGVLIACNPKPQPNKPNADQSEDVDELPSPRIKEIIGEWVLVGEGSKEIQFEADTMAGVRQAHLPKELKIEYLDSGYIETNLPISQNLSMKSKSFQNAIYIMELIDGKISVSAVKDRIVFSYEKVGLYKKKD